MKTVTILYKSGARVKIRCRALRIEKRGGELLSVEWEAASPKPLFLGVEEIAAIYEGTA